MKIEKINDNEIKVTISLYDLEQRNIDLNCISYDSPAIQELIWDMIDQAEQEFGFNAYDSELIVEPSPDFSDGFIAFISKVDSDDNFESIQKYIKNKLTNKDIKPKKRTKKVYATQAAYVFDSLEDIFCMSRRLSGKFSGDNSLYKLQDKFYLIMTFSSTANTNIKFFETVLSEYGTKVGSICFIEGYLNEYGEKMIEGNAIQTLCKYFD